MAKLNNDPLASEKRLERAGLARVAGAVKKAEGLTLSIFFSAKTHKEACAFRAIVSERGTWQRQLGTYLQSSLTALPVRDPFLVKTRVEVFQFFEHLSPRDVLALSVDVKDLYYSLPHEELLAAVQEAIEELGEVRFQYLCSSLKAYDGTHYVQKAGVCIGSCLAPVLSVLLLARYDREFYECMHGSGVVHVFRYKDDFLILFTSTPGAYGEKAQIIVRTFGRTLGSFKRTSELCSDNSVRFLDLVLHFQHDHVYWECSPRSKKSFLPFSSAHSKTVKRGIALSAMRNALFRSGAHLVHPSFSNQI